MLESKPLYEDKSAYAFRGNHAEQEHSFLFRYALEFNRFQTHDLEPESASFCLDSCLCLIGAVQTKRTFREISLGSGIYTSHETELSAILIWR
jgi:hypothetical protein